MTLTHQDHLARAVLTLRNALAGDGFLLPAAVRHALAYLEEAQRALAEQDRPVTVRRAPYPGHSGFCGCATCQRARQRAEVRA